MRAMTRGPEVLAPGQTAATVTAELHAIATRLTEQGQYPPQMRFTAFAVPLDEDLAEVERLDFIKMDIEGAEQRALKGAARTMAKFRPSLAICTYHRQDDLDAIPPIVLAANSAYTAAAKRIAAGGFIRPKVLFFY